MPRRPGAGLYEWLQMMMGCVLAAVVLFNCLARLTRVDGHSMDDTLQDGEMMLVWSLGYQPEQGDIVVLNKTTADLPLGRDQGHRQAGHRRGRSDGGHRLRPPAPSMWTASPLDEPYIKEPMYRPTRLRSPECSRPTGRCPRAPSLSWGTTGTTPPTAGMTVWGTIDEDYVLGKVVLALWPPDRFGLM